MWQIKRLVEGKCFPVDVKCKSRRVISFSGIVIFVSNSMPEYNEAFNRRLNVVEAPEVWNTYREEDVLEEKVHLREKEVVWGEEVVEISSSPITNSQEA